MFETIVILIATIIAVLVVSGGNYGNTPSRPITPTRKGRRKRNCLL